VRQLPVVAEPFPHAVVDGWWDPDLLHAVYIEAPGPSMDGWRRYRNGNEAKYEGPPALWSPAMRTLMDRIGETTATLQEAFGIEGLRMETVGGGYHLIPPGGFLNVHTDFSRSPASGLYRRLNLLVYLNLGWQDPGGRLEMWNDERMAVEVAPEFNRTVVFETSARSWHGHPRTAERWRMSVAAYFFTAEPPEGFREQSTVWHAR
jgi:hypothetical protein